MTPAPKEPTTNETIVPTIGVRVLTTLTKKRLPLLFPQAAAKPSMLFWVWLLPQALLLYLNWQAWNLVSGEMSETQRNTGFCVFIIETILWIGGAALFAGCQFFKHPIPRIAGAGLLAASSVYLAFVFIEGNSVIPASVQQWMLQPEQWLYKQFALVGLGALYGAFRWLCPDRSSDLASGSLITLAALASPFVLILFSMGMGISGSFLRIDFIDLKYVFIPLYIAASMLAVGGVLRICISAYTALKLSHPRTLAGFTLVIALVLPVCGLLLNSSIPFPVDFQIPAIYTLAVINGIILTLPNFSHPVLHRIVWLAQCLMLPFTVYFFVVFLPVLPLMPIAAICMCLGLLICVPSALFLLHACRILDGIRTEISNGSRWLPPILASATILLGPALLTMEMLRNRTALNQALDYLQYPDYLQPAVLPGSRAGLRSALLNLRNFKDGHYLPFYSEFYNWLVFDNLLLPDHKLNETWLAFFGEAMPKSAATKMQLPFLARSNGRNNQEILSGPVGTRPPANATTKSLNTVVATAPHEIHVTAQIVAANPTDQPTEYRARIHIPSGVWITGMRLTIDGERVPARLFEERAALWVYNQITEVRPVPQDPAILRYIGPETAELRVYPVPGGGTRSVEVGFAYPDNFSPAITVDGQSLSLPTPRENTALISGTTAWVPFAAVAAIPPIQRVPQPNLVLDISKGSHFQNNAAALGLAIHSALDAFPTARTARIFFVNFDVRDFRNGIPLPIDELRQMDPAILLEAAGRFEGGFLEALGIKSALARQQFTPQESVLQEFPAIVALRGSKNSPEEKNSAAHISAGQLPEFARFVPDEPVWWSLDPGATTPARHDLDPEAKAVPSATSVRVFKIGAEHFAVAADRPGLLITLNQDPLVSLAIYDSNNRQFVPVPTATDAGTNVAAGASVWALAFQRVLQPAAAGPDSLTALVAAARKASVLVPSTSYMVVENSAQWKMLERTEKKTLKAHEAFVLSETSTTPEPGVIALLIIAGTVLIIRHRLSRRTIAIP